MRWEDESAIGAWEEDVGGTLMLHPPLVSFEMCAPQTVAGSNGWWDLFWTLFSPITVFHIR